MNLLQTITLYIWNSSVNDGNLKNRDLIRKWSFRIIDIAVVKHVSGDSIIRQIWFHVCQPSYIELKELIFEVKKVVLFYIYLSAGDPF